MIIDFDEYIEKLYVVETDKGGYLVLKETPEKIKKELKRIDEEYFKYMKIHILEFEK